MATDTGINQFMVSCDCLHHCISSRKKPIAMHPRISTYFVFLKESNLDMLKISSLYRILYDIYWIINLLEVFRENYLAESDAQNTKMVSSNRMLRGISTGAY